MKCIDDLFDWILEEIFKRLPRESRLTCKEVCQRWLEILMTRAIFQEDRHIYLRKKSWTSSHITPYSAFENAKFAYEILTIIEEPDPIFRSIRSIFIAEENYLLWPYLGRSIKKVYMETEDMNLLGIFYEMPLVEEIVWHEDFSLTAKSIFETYERNGPFLPNLRKIEFRNWDRDWDFDDTNITGIHLAQLRKIFPNDLQIKVKQCTILDTNIDALDWIVENFAPEQFDVQVCKDPNDFSHKLLSLEKLPETKICFSFYDDDRDDDEPHFGYLDSFFGKHSNIKSVRIESKFAPFPKPYTQITELCIWPNDQLTSFKMFECLENLEHFEFQKDSNGANHYLIGHENINLPKLKCLKLDQTNINCSECAKAIATSFPSMEEFTGKFCFRAGSILGLMLKNWKELKTMRFMCDEMEKYENCIIDLEERPNLEVLEIRSVNPDTEEDFQLSSKVFPNLRSLSLRLKDVKKLDILLNANLQGLSKLRNLEISVQGFYNLQMNASIEKIFENHGKSLRKCLIIHRPESSA